MKRVAYFLRLHNLGDQWGRAALVRGGATEGVREVVEVKAMQNIVGMEKRV